MRKTERINTMMRYINNRAHFTISEIMSEFQISRSTAIRDLREIEAMGLPLIAEVGRDGGYSVLKNSFLPSVRFTDDEVKALFIAFMATRNQQLPYLKSRQSLAEKLLGLLSENQQDDLVVLNQLLLFEGTNPYNPDLLDLSDLPHPILEKLILAVLQERYVSFVLKEETVSMYVLHLYREKSIWFVEGIDLQKGSKRVLAVDSLTDIQTYDGKTWGKRKIHEYCNQSKEVNVVVELGPKAVAQFKKYHPFKQTLAYTSPYQLTARLETVVDVNQGSEVEEMINWLLFLGKEVQFRQLPPILAKGVKQRLSAATKDW